MNEEDIDTIKDLKRKDTEYEPCASKEECSKEQFSQEKKKEIRRAPRGFR